MIYIGTNCVSSRIYEKLHIPFNNPLCWGRMIYTDFKKLLTNWENINFDNINISKLNNSHILIDNQIDFFYQHYKYDKNYETPTKNGIDIFYKKIYQYIFEKYFERLQRMDKNDKKTYILHQQITQNEYQITDDECLDFINTKTTHQKILATPYKKFLKYSKDNLKIFIVDEKETTGNIANLIIKNLKL